MEKIFVQIASYRDPECQWTVKDLFEKAKHPERVFVGICWQFIQGEDDACFTVPPARPAQVRTILFHPDAAQGSGWAHAQAQTLWDGEDYVLQIHAHMRFEQDWDETLIQMLARCPSDRPALTTCLAGYVPPGTIPFRDDARASFVFVSDVKPQEPQLVNLLGALVDKSEELAAPSHVPFWVGPFLFGPATMFQEVPFDPHIQYYGETLAYSARLFTHGWDLFEPDQMVLYHWWGRDFAHPRPYRDFGTERQKHSFMRVKHLLRFDASGATAAIVELDKYGLGTVRSIDDYWAFAGIDLRNGKCTELARKGRWNQSFQEMLERKNSDQPKRPRIFVQIASYRDPECQWTVKDLFEKAKDPGRVFVGICWQHDPEEDKAFFEVTTRPDQVRTALFHWKESQGVCWARRQTQLLWEGEEYTLMIDSHMRFEFDWDERLIEDLAMCDSPKPVISNYPAAFTPPHNLDVGVKPTIQRPHPYEDGDIRFRGDNLDRFPEKPLKGAFIAAGLMFAKSDIIREIPYDPYLYFNQEELSLAVRLYTHGWDVYHMRQVLIYHLYVTGPETKTRALHWEDNTKWTEMQQRARKRMDHMMGYAQSDDPTVKRDLMKYGLGTERTLDEFSQYSGVDFKRRVVTERGLRCAFITDLKKYKDKRIFIPEVDRLEDYDAEIRAGEQVMAFPDPEKAMRLRHDVMLLSNNSRRELRTETSAPEGILVIHDYLDRNLCESMVRYAQGISFAASPHGPRAEIDGMAGPILSIFNDAFTGRLSPYYNQDFEWYERPFFLRHEQGTRHGPLTDSDQWIAQEKRWIRAADRDFTVKLVLSDVAGGEMHFPEHNYRITPRAGMLVAYPSHHGYLQSLQPVVSGTRFDLMSWGAALGSRRAKPLAPYASVFLRQKRPS